MIPLRRWISLIRDGIYLVLDNCLGFVAESEDPRVLKG